MLCTIPWQQCVSPPDQFPQDSWCCFHIMEHDKTFTSATVQDGSASHAQETAWTSGRKTGQKTGGCIIHQAIQTDLPSLDLNRQAALAPVWFGRALIRQGSRIFCSTHDLLWTSGTRGPRLLPGISNKRYMWAHGTRSVQRFMSPKFCRIDRKLVKRRRLQLHLKCSGWCRKYVCCSFHRKPTASRWFLFYKYRFLLEVNANLSALWSQTAFFKKNKIKLSSHINLFFFFSCTEQFKDPVPQKKGQVLLRWTSRLWPLEYLNVILMYRRASQPPLVRLHRIYTLVLARNHNKASWSLPIYRCLNKDT